MPKKRPNGEGNLRKRPNGLWECTVMDGFKPDGKRKYKSFYGHTQKEVKEKLKQYNEEKERSLLSSDMSFSEWADKWYKSIEGTITQGTYDNYRYTLTILKAYFGDKPLEAIKAIHVEEMLKYMVKNGKSKSYITKLRGMLFQIMKKAEANDLIHKNPVACADKQRAPESENTKDAFTADEISRLMLFLPDDRIGNSIRLMLGTGLRSQEVLALTPAHIAEDGSCVYVRQAVKMVKGTPTIGVPKTKKSYRDVPVPQKIRDAALMLRNSSTGYIWHGDTIPVCNPSVFRKQFKKALTEVGDVRLLSPHCCRHTYVSQMQAMGVPIETIQSLTGHADIDMTQHYLHVQREVRDNAASRLNELFETVSDRSTASKSV